MRLLFTLLLIVSLSGCAHRVSAPVTSRGIDPAPEPSISRPAGAVVTRPARPISTPASHRPERYTVRRGDTMYSVAWAHGLTVGELARQNRIHPPYTIYPGQRLQVAAPEKAVAPLRLQPLPAPRTAQSGPVSKPVARQVPKPAKHVAPETAPEPPAGAAQTTARQGAAYDGNWQWPTRGRVLRGFQPNANGKKGIDIGGHNAQPVKAAAGGKVVYAGSGLVGYGRLIIVKHNENLLSAYGHNSKLLVNEGDYVKAGDTIARMGNSGTNRTALYFEIRKDGKPVNPLHYLPRN